ncbi:response regulator [bacterium]|nr:response regulator [candidate division CSSED10-310 bacterium]
MTIPPTIKALDRRRHIRWIYRFAFPIIAIASICVLAYRTDGRLRVEILGHVRLAAETVNLERIQALTGEESDQESLNYLKIKNQLRDLCSTHPLCRFIYLVRRHPDPASGTDPSCKKGPIFFLVDSEPVGSENESPPGQLYLEASEDFHRVFDTLVEDVEGPLTDRWGTWVTAFLPLVQPGTGKVIAVLCMDIDARNWNRAIIRRIAIPATLVLIIVIALAIPLIPFNRYQIEPYAQDTHPGFRLRQKMGLILVVFLTMMFIVLYMGSRFVIQEGFAMIEAFEVRKDVDRVLLAMKERKNELISIVQDWAYWDSTYTFAHDANEDYIRENLTSETFSVLRIHLLIIADVSGHVQWAGAVDPDKPSELISGEAFEEIWGDFRLPDITRDLNTPCSGIMLQDQIPVLMAISPILTSKREGPVHGYFLMGRRIDEYETEKLATTLKLNLSLIRTDRNLNTELSEIVKNLIIDHHPIVHPLDNEILTAYGLLNSIDDRPALLARISMTRDVYRQALQTTNLLAVILSFAGIASILIIFALIRKLVLVKLEYLSHNIHRIIQSGNFSGSISWKGSDELAELTHDINRLLEAVTRSRWELVTNEQFLAATLGSIGDGVISCDTTGRVTNLNRAAEILTGWSLAEAKNLPLHDIFKILNSRTRESIATPIERVIQEGVTIDLANDTALLARNGTERQIADSFAPIRDSSGAVIGAVLVFHDMTEEYQRREILRNSEAFQRELLLNLPAGVLIIDPVTRMIELVNEYAASLTGSTVEHMVGQRCHRFICPAEENTCPICDLGNVIDNSERLMLRSDGTCIPILKTVKRMELGGQEKLLECFVDISDRKAAENRLRAFTQCLLEFSTDTRANINRLVEICGLLLHGTSAFYNRLEHDVLASIGQWRTPPDFESHVPSEGSICLDVIVENSDQPMVIRNLQESTYADTDQWMSTWGIETCIGMVVRSRGSAVGALCVVFQDDTEPIEDHLNLLRLAGFAIAVEKERQRQVQMQELLTGIAATYIDLPLDKVDETVQQSLGDMGRFVDADRVYIFEYDFDRDICRNTHEWCANGIEPQIEHLQDMPLSLIPDWVQSHQSGDVINIPDVFTLPQDNAIRRILEPQSIRSLMTVPLMDADRCLGFVGFDYVVKAHECDRQEEHLLTMFSQMMTSIRLRREAEDALRQHQLRAEAANRAKSAFLANMSHEIRTPMNGVIGMTSLLLDTHLNQEQRQYAELAVASADSLLSLLNDILDFSKMEAGKLVLDHHDFSLRKLIDEGMAPLALQAQKKGVEFIISVNPDVTDHLFGDSSRLRQILLNLAGNAVKFTDKGEIIISVMEVTEREFDSDRPCESAGGVGIAVQDDPLLIIEDERSLESVGSCLLRFTVTDTGIGIAKDKQELLFQKFSQVDASSTRRFGGTGLGLAIARQLTSLMGGEIGIESQENQGATFWFTTRLRKRSETQLDMNAATTITETLSKVNILIVDDNATQLRVLSSQLQAWGFHTYTATSGPKALHTLDENLKNGTRIQIAILDNQMPDMDGIELVQVIRQNPLFNSMRLIILVSMDQTGDTQRFRQVRVDAWLTKPVRVNTLFDTIQTLLTQNTSPPVTTPVSESEITAPPITPRILLIEDNETNRMVTENTLRKLGIQTESAGNGFDALDLLERNRFDLILMDIQMPRMDGFETTRRIRDREAAIAESTEVDPALNRETGRGHIPIIAMTAHTLDGDMEKCLEAGMNDYLSKPIEHHRLQDALMRWLPHRDWLKTTSQINPVSEKKSFADHSPRLGHNSQNGSISNTHVSLSATSAARASLVFNRDAFLERLLGDEMLAEMVLRGFLEDIPHQIESLYQAIQSGDTKQAENCAHSIKGASASIGAEVLYEISAQMEQAGKKKDREALEVLMGKVKAAFDVFRRISGEDFQGVLE